MESDKTHKYDSIIIESFGILTTTEWNGNNGGILTLKTHSIIIKSNGQINVNGKGYKGGKAKDAEYDGIAYQGESYKNASTMNTDTNYGGGGGSICSQSYGVTGGGGGGYGTNGNDEEPNRYPNNGGNNPGGKGGVIYGDPKLTNLYLGSGGGSGHPYNQSVGKCGGNG